MMWGRSEGRGGAGGEGGEGGGGEARGFGTGPADNWGWGLLDELAEPLVQYSRKVIKMRFTCLASCI